MRSNCRQIDRTGGIMRTSLAAVAISMAFLDWSWADDSSLLARQHTNIASQDLSSALRELAKERQFFVLMRADIVRDVHTAGATGNYTTDEALRTLLNGTGFTYQHLDEKTVTIVPFRDGAIDTTATSDPGPGVRLPRYAWANHQAEPVPPPATSAPASSGSRGENAPPESPLQRTDHEAIGLQEVVVTARKREERLLEVPSPVSVISALTLERTKAQRVEEYLTLVPGVTFDTDRAGQTKVTFRGIDVGDSNATSVVYLDNTPLTPAGPNANSGFLTPSLDPSDLAMIEVDRGPQGTLYGANAIGGILKYVTVKPDPNRFSGRFEVGGDAARHGDKSGLIRGAVNIPMVADKVGLRLSGFRRDDPGYIDDPHQALRHVNNARWKGGRGALLWNLSETISVNLSGMVQRMRSNGNDTVDIDPFTRQFLYGDLTRERFLHKEWFKSRNDIYSADILWDLKWARFLSTTSYSELHNGADTDLTPSVGGPAVMEAIFGRPNLGFEQPLVVHGNKFTQELRLTSPGDSRLEWQAGLFYTRNRMTWDQAVYLFDIPSQALVSDFGPMFQGYLRNRYAERAVFGNVDYHFTPEFDVSVGVRYSNARQSLRSEFEGALLGPPLDFDEPQDEHAVTWAFNPRYRFSADSMAYARIATGYRPGGVAVMTADALAAGLSPIFKSDRVTNYEIGWKASLFDRRVTMDLSAYYIRWVDLQESITIDGFIFLSNGGKAHSQGIEAAFTWMPLTGLNLAASITYNSNRLDRDAQTNPDLSQSGARLPGTPKFSGNFSVDYNWPVSGGTQAFVGASVFSTSTRPNGLSLGYDPTKASLTGPVPNFATIPIYNSTTNEILGYASTKLPSYTTVDLRAGLEHGPWTMQVYVKNLADERVFNGLGGPNSTPSSDAPPIWGAVALQPRIVGLSLAWKF